MRSLLSKHPGIVIAVVVYGFAWSFTYQFSERALYLRIWNDERHALAIYDSYPGAGPVTIDTTSYVVPAPFLSRITWSTKRALPPVATEYGKSGWFIITPFGATNLATTVLWGSH